MKKKIIIGLFGVAGFNRGDDAITISLARGFRRELRDVRFIAPVMQNGRLCDKYIETFILNKKSFCGLVNLIKNIWKCDVIVLGGGSLIQDRLGGSRLRGVIGYAWLVSFFAKRLGKILISAPIGVDALSTTVGKRAAREIVERMDVLTVRDRLSEYNAANLETNTKIVLAADPVYAWTSDVGSTQNHYVLAPAFENVCEDLIVNLFANIAESLLENHPDMSVFVLAMDERTIEDGGKIGAIKNAISSNYHDRVVLCVPRTVVAATAVLRSSKGVVAMRLHSLILSVGYTKTTCISRTTKTDAIVSDFSLESVQLCEVNESNIKDLSSRLVSGLLKAVEVRDKEVLAEKQKMLDNYYREVTEFIISKVGSR